MAAELQQARAEGVLRSEAVEGSEGDTSRDSDGDICRRLSAGVHLCPSVCLEFRWYAIWCSPFNDKQRVRLNKKELHIAETIVLSAGSR